jgi:class 3 adenylate cyclase
VDELPIGTVTFLFTDIEGSTRLLKQWRERYAEALADHQRILRGAFVEHDGHEIDTSAATRSSSPATPRSPPGRRACCACRTGD